MSRLLAPCALALSLAACSPGNDTQAGKTLNIAFFGDNTTLVSVDPFQVYWLEHRVLLRNVAESLTDQDPQTGKIIPWLAKSWEVSDDALTYTFHLRDNVTFSNGERFDAKAVKIAFDSDKALATELPATFGATYLAGYDHAEVVDDFTVKLVLSKPNAGFLQATSTTNLAILAPASYALTVKERSLGKIIGTGPFVLASYTPEVGAHLTKRKGYAWASANMKNQGEAHLDAVDISYIPEESVRNGLFLQGKADILWPRNPFSEVDLKLFQSKGATIQSRSLPGPALNLYPNTRGERILADPHVRLAVQKALDRKSYASTVYNAEFPVVDGIFDVTTPYFKSQGNKLAYDPAGAEQLLDHAGWTKGADGYRHKNGKRLSLSYNISPAETAGDVLIQDQLRKVGIELKLSVVTRAEWVANNSAGNYDLTINYMTRADPIILQTILDPRSANSSTLATNTYEPAALDKAKALFDAGITATQSQQRAAAYGDLQDLLIDESSAFPVYERVWQAATSPKVKNFRWTAEGFALLGDIEIGTP
ncbi:MULTISPECIES: ABC transporter substrate-binding protein [Pseudomonas fluorescens group]|uniref:ABC transporter, periplasmic binding protein n=2 Tax=Pseudomonas fluorescens TaxID=294 RepID=C3KB35_PSEFS|nr:MULTISPECIES: ABC transporter substrate-binding protein [Pseudomonas fluorescens group]MBZ6453983.1 ABC transporter substrate-binding protein [Pseudomonas fluorescens group sp.]MBZ6459969.1 ABC transporter substrate-binding protein [Pseudomonas fluorescens group sp.]MBZ6466860.1 ABC transporter substrate-binding protein [Pseudomonas fluorescens group sp.]WPN26714.1 ABC transporter substrate-binding protein [Pseudomonas marginalis]WQD75354.1 ABC transporter substrate-binding protein [Pseudom